MVSGKVLYTDGKTPAAKVSVRVVRTPDNKEVYTTETDGNGFYKLTKLPPGHYSIIYGDKVLVKLVVVPGNGPVLRFLNVIIQRGPKPPLPLATLLLLLAGGVIAVGVGVGVGAGGGGGGGHVSGG